MRILAGIIVYIDTGKRFLFTHDVRHRLHHIFFRRITVVAARPDAVVIILVIQMALVYFCCGNIADKYR